jgi:hypothetical protein
MVILNQQLYWEHEGGEIYFAGPMLDNWNYSYGFRNIFYLDGGSKIGIKMDFMKCNTQHNHHILSEGKGVLSEIYFKTGNFKFFIDYWDELPGTQFLTHEGNPLYQHDEWLFFGFDFKAPVDDKFYFRGEIETDYFIDKNNFS